MTVIELQRDCLLDDSVMNEFKECHPKQIIDLELTIPVWKIEYRYRTNRGNDKEAVKYLFRHHADWDIAERDFHLYIDRFNEEHPERMLSNVKILDAYYLGKVYLKLE